jgi:alpha-galactosidase
MTGTSLFHNDLDHTTIIVHSETSAWLSSLWDFECGLGGKDSGPANTRGLCLLETSDRCYEADDFRLVEFQPGQNQVQMCWQVGEAGLLWRSRWKVEPGTGVWSRRDELENTGPSPIEIRRCLARFAFSPGRYEIHTQASNWAHENQGHWNEFFGGVLTLRSYYGRTTQIATPYLFLRESGSDHGIAFHILPRGNWAIHIDRTRTTWDELAPFHIIELGLSDRSLRIHLQPGHTLQLPEILIQDIPSNQPEAGSAFLHQYLLQNRFPNRKTAPVVYNTWFDQFDSLDVDRLHSQLSTAREIGCEIFTIDAGWYGRGEGGWHSQVGDWREKLDGAFRGEMKAFADEVRSAGLGFGLWVEPERNGPQAPIVQEHPEWFRPGLGGFFYPDLVQPSAYQYIFHELCRLVDEYGLAWMKVDFNFDLGDASDEHDGYFDRWYRLMDELRARYPNTFFEGCASGGMRLDLNTLSHFDGHFLSDTVNPVDVLRITQGAMLRLPPGLINKWAVLRERDGTTFTPGGGSWDNAVQADVDFLCRVAMPGMLGISGDLIGLRKETRQRLQDHITFYKEWRGFLHEAACQLLTPIRPMDDRSGWLAFQLQSPFKPGTSLVFAYRLLDGLTSKTFHLKGLQETQAYRITDIDTANTSQIVSGHELGSKGLTVALHRPNSAAIWIVQAVSSNP